MTAKQSEALSPVPEANDLRPRVIDTNILRSSLGTLRLLADRLLLEVKTLEGFRLATGTDVAKGIDLDYELLAYEVRLIRLALRLTRGNQRRAARLLNLKNTTLNARIKRYRIDTRPDAVDSTSERDDEAVSSEVSEFKSRKSNA